MTRSFVVSAVVAVAIVMAAGTGEAVRGDTYVYGNLGTVATQSTSNSVGYLNGVQNNTRQAQGFSVGSTPWELTEIDLGLANSGLDTPDPKVFLYSDNAGAPGSQLAAFNITNGSVQFKQMYFFTGSYTTSPSTNYWIVAEDANSISDQSSFEWYAEDIFTTPTERNSSGISYLGTKAQAFSVGAWSDTLPSLSLRVNAVAVPEPPTYAIAMVAGVLGAGAVARKKFKQNVK